MQQTLLTARLREVIGKDKLRELGKRNWSSEQY